MQNLLSSGGWFDYDNLPSKISDIENELKNKEIWSDRKKLAKTQKEHKTFKSSYEKLLKISDDLEMVKYTLDSLIKENLLDKNNELIGEMNGLVFSTEKLINEIEFNDV